MSTSRRARSRSLIRDAKGRYRESPLVTEKHRKVLRQLLTVLEELIDENEDKEDMKERPKSVIQESDDRDPAGKSDREAIDEAVTHRTRTSSRPAPEREAVLKKVDDYVIQRYKKSLDDFTQLSYQIRGSLTSLGGGGRAAKALRELQESFSKIYEEYIRSLSGGSDSAWKKLDILGCVTLLRNAQTGLDEVTNSFKELEISNDSFKNELTVFRSNLFEAAIILKAEYGQFKDIELAGDYIEREILDPLTTAFETFSAKLRDGVDKEVAMIRKAQNFSGQRYLNLTTVATFLSSVTATTLQITIGNQQSVQSVLSIVMNTMWFTSLVFSTASAVYSLLIMTWRQSPVRQFDNDSSHIPSWFLAFLRNGPVFTLIAAVIAFSVGLCILAFQTAIQQGLIATAIVPIVFAGGHANFLLLVSGWFLWEQWRAKHLEFWTNTKDKNLIPRLNKIKEYRVHFQGTLENIKESILRFFSSILSLRGRNRASSVGSDIQPDIEKDADLISRGHVTMAVEMIHPPSDQNELGSETQDVQDNTNPELLRASPSIEVTPESPNAGDNKSSLEHPVFQSALQFSPNGAFLAFAHGHRVTIYDSNKANPYFPMVRSIEVDDKKPVKLITWSDRDHLLVQAERSINIWRFDSSPSKDSTDATKEPWGSIIYDIEPSAIHWTSDESRSEVEDMIIVVHHDLVNIYDSRCKSVRSIDFSDHGLYIVDAVSLDSSRLLCLTRDMEEGRVIVFNFETRIVEKSGYVFSNDNHTLILSKKKDKALLHGSENITTLVTIENDELQTTDLWSVTPYHQELRIPGGAIGFYGKDDELIYGVSGYEIVILRPSTDEDYFSYNALHIITSPNFDSETALPNSFSFRPNTVPYRFAFGLPDGRVKVWSIQSDTFFKDGDPEAPKIDVHDRKGRNINPGVSSGKCFTITSPRESEDDQQELE
ncbi:WD40 domain containing protein [Pyrrhoderma noxium]|uniref:WD40 domain containing protein n=1 Tax=Pyrrhoderma noxium TaxID=2282107 RepID=A0A286UG30_9AGAM|nr:WD40 domain containing protein [Pyrrhoderma noxium]